MDLGWEPPSPKSRWDLLPVVAMAENDAPAIAELPDELRNLVSIEHPAYPAQFQKLDLKWYQFPALSRLGFDIGGVQYTAAPFIGW
jgi:nitric oxide synthase oxygenase domain/subunit